MFARLGFSVAVHVDCDIFIADEVLAVGDRPFKRKCLKRMKEIRESGITMFYVSHSAGSVKRMCDRAIVLDKGKVGFDGDVDEAIKYLHYDERATRSSGRATTPWRRHLRRAATSSSARERCRSTAPMTPSARMPRTAQDIRSLISENHTMLNRRVDWKLHVCSYSETLP